MPQKKRTSKRRPEDELTFKQLMDLLFQGPLGIPGDDGRIGEMWECEEDREAAYWAHRDRVLRGFPESGTPPPHAIDCYEPVGNELHRAAVEHYLARIVEDRDRADRINHKHGWEVDTPERREKCDTIAALEELLAGVPDAGEARRIADHRRRLQVRDDQASAAVAGYRKADR